MTLFKDIFGLSCLFIALIMVCAWLDAKYIAPLRQANKPPEPAPQQTLANLRNLYDCYSLHYENFAVSVFDCLTAVARQYRLVQVNNPRGVHSARAADRVRKLKNGATVFIYELRREPDDSGFRSTNSSRIDSATIAGVFETDLPFYLRNGYNFNGHVVGFDIDDKTLRLEIYGVGRQVIDNGGNLII